MKLVQWWHLCVVGLWIGLVCKTRRTTKKKMSFHIDRLCKRFWEEFKRWKKMFFLLICFFWIFFWENKLINMCCIFTRIVFDHFKSLFTCFWYHMLSSGVCSKVRWRWLSWQFCIDWRLWFWCMVVVEVFVWKALHLGHNEVWWSR